MCVWVCMCDSIIYGTAKDCYKGLNFNFSLYTKENNIKRKIIKDSFMCLKDTMEIFSFLDRFIFILLMCMSVYLCEPMPHMCSFQLRLREHRIPGAGVKGGWKYQISVGNDLKSFERELLSLSHLSSTWPSISDTLGVAYWSTLSGSGSTLRCTVLRSHLNALYHYDV